jgi:cell division septal protein FtsQ
MEERKSEGKGEKGDTKWARAQARTLRSKLLKIGALVKVSVRRVFPDGSRDRLSRCRSTT